MATTSIEWTERSWNFLAGCSLASPGCKHCYAAPMAARIARMNPALLHYQGLTQPSKTGPQWTGKIGFAPHKLTEPLTVKKPAMWFVNSMSDLFHEDVPDSVIDKAFAVMALAPQHTFQVLTKRSARMRKHLSDDATMANIRNAAEAMFGADHFVWAKVLKAGFPLPNVWLGVSVEDQKRADERIPDLLATPAAVRWISAEPLLGPVSLVDQCNGHYFLNSLEGLRWHDAPDGVPTFKSVMPPGNPKLGDRAVRIDWVVVGGESGKGARPMHPDWARSLRDQCAAAGVAFFFKQWGEWGPIGQRMADGLINNIVASPKDWSPAAHAWKVGKARAGRLLDGIEHNGFPRPSHDGRE